ncbi:MAG: DUF4491 family protein [Firmicutes bacterium]|nr:DUF4491 family protein [Bacillota bacterium]
MRITGILIGAGTFLIIGALHPVVIKAEYHIGKRCWPAFLIAGLASIAGALFCGTQWLSSLLAVLGFSLLWCIGELFEQEKRVAKGWFPAKAGKEKSEGGKLTRCD